MSIGLVTGVLCHRRGCGQGSDLGVAALNLARQLLDRSFGGMQALLRLGHVGGLPVGCGEIAHGEEGVDFRLGGGGYLAVVS